MRLLLLFTLIASFQLSAQKFQLLDQQTKDPVSFGKVMPEKETPRLTDIDGYFSVLDSNQWVKIRATGFYDTSIVLNQVVDGKIYLKSKAQNVQEVVVKPGVNPAECIMAQVIANRMKNHPFENDGFISKQYSKFVFDLDDASRKILEDSVVDPTDTNLYSMKQFFGRQHLFLIETASKHYFEPPYKEKETSKLYYTIGEVSEMFDVNTSLIRFWEKEFDILKPKKSKKGNRLFTKDDVDNFKLIHHLVKERGFTLNGAKDKLKKHKFEAKKEVEMVQSLEKVKKFLLALKKEL